MKLEQYKEDYYKFSGKLSDNARKLAFAGIAIVWIFKQEKEGTFILPAQLQWAMLMFAGSLFFDLLQYTYQTITWGIFHRYYEKKAEYKEDTELTASPYWNWPSNALLWLKILVLFIGYLFLLKFIFLR